MSSSNCWDDRGESFIAALRSYEHLQELVRDRVLGVARKFHNGLFISGRPGTGKTHTVVNALKDQGRTCRFVVESGRISAAGLFDLLKKHRDDVIVLDDVPSVFASRSTQEILLPALGGVAGKPRKITWNVRNREERTEFAGGIIAISNVSLGNGAVSAAISSRVKEISFEPSDDELAAVMRMLADQGVKGLSSFHSHETVEFLIDEARALGMRIDLRHFFDAMSDRKQAVEGEATTTWRELIRSNLGRRPTEMPQRTTKKEQMEEERKLVAHSLTKFSDTEQQMSFCRLKKSTFYVRRNEVLKAAANG